MSPTVTVDTIRIERHLASIERRHRRRFGYEQRSHRDEKDRWYGLGDVEAVKQRIVSRLGWML